MQWQEEKKLKRMSIQPDKRRFISVIMVKKFYPDPVKLKVFDNRTKKVIKLRGREELEIILRKKAQTERIDIGMLANHCQ